MLRFGIRWPDAVRATHRLRRPHHAIGRSAAREHRVACTCLSSCLNVSWARSSAGDAEHRRQPCCAEPGPCKARRLLRSRLCEASLGMLHRVRDTIPSKQKMPQGGEDSVLRWIPHSVLARPRQRPARGSSPGRVRDVQGMQPIDEKPAATRGCCGRLAVA